MSKKRLTIKVTLRDETHERWFNNCVGRKYQAIEKNATCYEIVDNDTYAGCLINKNNCVTAPGGNRKPRKRNSKK